MSLNDFADRTPRALKDGEVIDIGGGRRVRFIDTPHTPHGWDAGVLFDESTQTLIRGDLFTQLGNDRALTSGEIVGPAIAAEDVFNYSSLNPAMGATIRNLSALAPRMLAVMHGPSFTGDGAAALRGLADDYDRRVSGKMLAPIRGSRLSRRRPGRAFAAPTASAWSVPCMTQFGSPMTNRGNRSPFDPARASFRHWCRRRRP